MITGSDGRVSGFSIKGHSGTADYGHDLVCASVSALAQTAIVGVEEYLHREVKYERASGKLNMTLKDTPDDLTETIFQTMLLGFQKIKNGNPEAIEISWQRR